MQQQKNPIKKWAELSSRYFSKRKYIWPIAHEKMLSITNERNTNQNGSEMSLHTGHHQKMTDNKR